MLPLVNTLRNATAEELRADATAGLTTAIMLVPQAMAYAMLAGLEPIVGLYASTLPIALYALFGSSRPLAVGPVAMDSLMVAAGLIPLLLTSPAEYASAAAMLALMVGGIQMLLGLLRAGFLVRFLAQPVILGFTAAAALIIGLSQLKSALGVELPRSQQAHVILLAAVQKFGSIHPLTLALSVTSVVTLVMLKKKAPRFPRFLLVVAVGTALVWLGGLDQQGVAIVGAVPAGLPALSAPSVSLDQVTTLLPIAFAIALVAMMEAIAVAKRYDDDVSPNRELLSLGLANVGSSLVGGYPVTGGFSRTAVNAQAGARSPLAGLITSAVVVVTLLFFTQSFYFLPKAVLASIILTAVAGLVDVAGLKRLWATCRVDFWVAAITFGATLTLGIQLGMATGVAASFMSFLWRTAQPTLLHEENDGTLVLRIAGPLYFGNVEAVETRLAALEESQSFDQVVFDATGLGALDSVAQSFLTRLEHRYDALGIQLDVRRVPPVRRAS
jgi:SulP family sulfate permease